MKLNLVNCLMVTNLEALAVAWFPVMNLYSTHHIKLIFLFFVVLH
jgi:hypothetical protein